MNLMWKRSWEKSGKGEKRIRMIIGNICFIGMLIGVKRLSKKSRMKEGKGTLLMIIVLFIFFLLLNPIGKEVRFLEGLIEEVSSSESGVPWGLGYMVWLTIFMPCCQMFLLKKRLYTKRKKAYKVYVYYDKLFILVVGLLCINYDGAFLIFVTAGGIVPFNVRLLLWVLVVVNYIWAVIASFLQGKELVMDEEEYHYNNMKKSVKGKMEDIEAVERREEEAFVFRIKGEELLVWCGLKTYYGDTLYEKCKERIRPKGDKEEYIREKE